MEMVVLVVMEVVFMVDGDNRRWAAVVVLDDIRRKKLGK